VQKCKLTNKHGSRKSANNTKGLGSRKSAETPKGSRAQGGVQILKGVHILKRFKEECTF
jgi:hypothetical protein